MDYATVANKIKDVFEAISGWTGKVYIYIPNIKSEEQYLDALLDSDTKEVDVWFIRRNSVRSRKYGEATRAVPSGYREKTHIFTIRGFQSVYEDEYENVLTATSESDFQERCDDIESAFSTTTSLDVSDHDVFLMSVDVDIDYDWLGSTFCHSATITLSVTETLRTIYEY